MNICDTCMFLENLISKVKLNVIRINLNKHEIITADYRKYCDS